MGLFDSISKTLFGGADYKTPQAQQASLGGQFQDIFLANFIFPQLFQYLQAASVAGEGGLNALKQFTKSGKDIPTGIGDIDFGKLSAALPEIKAKASKAQAQNFQATYDMFSKIPALSDIFSKASGNVDSTGALAKIFGDLSGAALGSASSSGFLTDPVKQGNVLGPLALQKYQIEQSVQQSNQAQALGLVGAGGLPSSGLFGMNSFGVDPFTQSSLQAGGLFGLQNAALGSQASFLNSQLGLQGSMFNAGQGADLFGMTAGFAAASPFGMSAFPGLFGG